MDQMEHNVKIHDYKKNLEPEPFVRYMHHLNCPQNHPSEQEQARMLERFKHVHWNRENVLVLPEHQNRMQVLREELRRVEEQQKSGREDTERHRLEHLEGIKRNIQESRERFARRTALERPGAVETQLDDRPLYKIINNGLPIKY